MLIPTVRALLLRDLAAVERELEAYGEEARIWATPPGVSNSAGTLALHLAGNLQHFIGARLGNNGYVRNRDAEFASRDVPRSELVAELRRASAAVGAALEHLDPARLGEEHPDSFTGGKRVTVGLLLGHLSAHLAYHLGQIDYHRRLVTGQGAIPGVVAVP